MPVSEVNNHLSKVGIARSQTLDHSSKNNANGLNFGLSKIQESNMAKLQRNASNIDISPKNARFDQQDTNLLLERGKSPLLQRSYSLNTQQLNDQYSRSVNMKNPVNTQNTGLGGTIGNPIQNTPTGTYFNNPHNSILGQNINNQQYATGISPLSTNNMNNFMNLGYGFAQSPYISAINPNMTHVFDQQTSMFGTPYIGALTPNFSPQMFPPPGSLNDGYQGMGFNGLPPSFDANNVILQSPYPANHMAHNMANSILTTPMPFSANNMHLLGQFSPMQYQQQFNTNSDGGQFAVLGQSPFLSGFMPQQSNGFDFSLPAPGDVSAGLSNGGTTRTVSINNSNSAVNNRSGLNMSSNMGNIQQTLGQLSQMQGYSEKAPGEMMLEELRNKMKNHPQSTQARNFAHHGAVNSSSMQNLNQKNVYDEVGITWGLKDIKGSVYDFARDQFGSRFIQSKLQDDEVPEEEKQELFRELMAYINLLCKDVFGNYVVQKLLDINVGTREQHNYIYRNAIKGYMYELSTHMYGCRVIQKLIEQVFGFTSHQYREMELSPSNQASIQALDSINNVANRLDKLKINTSISDDIYEMSTQDPLLLELKKDVYSLVTDQNGNHVIQKCIEQIRPIKRLAFFFDAFQNQYVSMSKHPYGCRVVQRVLENTNIYIIHTVISEIMHDVLSMMTDQYANYVVQHIIERHEKYTRLNDDGTMMSASIAASLAQSAERSKILADIAVQRKKLFSIIASNILSFSQHKFGSNVVECCLNNSTAEERGMLFDKLFENNTMVHMMKDPYANYVVQKVIDRANEAQRQQVIILVQQNEVALKRLTYGKHIINKLRSLN